jgi:hypothetical protein
LSISTQNKIDIASTSKAVVVVWSLDWFGPLVECGKNNNNNYNFDNYSQSFLLESGLDSWRKTLHQQAVVASGCWGSRCLHGFSQVANSWGAPKTPGWDCQFTMCAKRPHQPMRRIFKMCHMHSQENPIQDLHMTICTHDLLRLWTAKQGLKQSSWLAKWKLSVVIGGLPVAI